MLQIEFNKIYAKALAGDADSQFSLGQNIHQIFSSALSKVSFLDPDFCKLREQASNLVQAAKWYRMAAEKDHNEALYWLASCYQMGLGVAIDKEESEKLLRKAGSQGHSEALYSCGEIEKASELGNARALYDLSIKYCSASASCDEEYASNLAEGYAYCFAAIRFGSAQAMELQAEFEMRNADREIAEARAEEITKRIEFINSARDEVLRVKATKELEDLKTYTKLAETGSSEAQFMLGALYANGIGFEKKLPDWKCDGSRELALKWLLRSAESGYALAAHGLGLCYHTGRAPGTYALVEAYSWYTIASESVEDSVTYKHLLEPELTDAQIEEARTRSAEIKNAINNHQQGFKNPIWVWMTKEELKPYDESLAKHLQGKPVDRYDKLNIGLCYEIGYKVQADLAESYAFYHLASPTVERASKARDALALKMTSSQISLGMARADALRKIFRELT
jgi:TPR repeat protein